MIWGLAHPGPGEREAVAVLLARDHHLVRAGQVILGGKGLAGRDLEAFISGDLQAHLIRPDRKDEPAGFGKLARCRQWIEAITGTLKGQLTLEDHGGRTLAGVYARVAARLLALAAQLEDRHARQAIPDRLRPLKANGLTHLGRDAGTGSRPRTRRAPGPLATAGGALPCAVCMPWRY